MEGKKGLEERFRLTKRTDELNLIRIIAWQLCNTMQMMLKFGIEQLDEPDHKNDENSRYALKSTEPRAKQKVRSNTTGCFKPVIT